MQGELYKVGESDSQKVIKDWVPFAEAAVDRYFERISNSEFCTRVTQEVALSLAGGAVVNKAMKSAGRVIKAVAGKVAKKESGGGRVLIHPQPKVVTKTSTKKQQKSLNVGSRSNGASISKVAVKQEKSSAEVVANRNTEVQKTKTATSSQIANDVLTSNIQKNVLDKRASDAINKAPYEPKKAQNLATKLLDSKKITSSTVPGQSMPNVKLAGQCKERTIIINPETQETAVQRVVFDQRGFPIFDPYVKVETRISGDLANMTSDAHMRAATRQLKEDIISGRINRNQFTDAEWKQIKGGRERIGKYTWHHHQETGRMQLIPTDIHEWIKHVRGNNLWGQK